VARANQYMLGNFQIIPIIEDKEDNKQVMTLPIGGSPNEIMSWLGEIGVAAIYPNTDSGFMRDALRLRERMAK
jgi:hypothetical protein